jgi:hypothetical protein
MTQNSDLAQQESIWIRNNVVLPFRDRIIHLLLCNFLHQRDPFLENEMKFFFLKPISRFLKHSASSMKKKTNNSIDLSMVA